MRSPAPPSDLLDQFQRVYGTPPEIVVRAPGRVDLIGAHVDYNEGFVMPAAIARDAWLAVGAATGDTTSITAADFDQAARFQMDDLETGLDGENESLLSWARYPAGVAWALRTQGLKAPPLNAVLTSDVPIGAGVSSSAAVEVAFGLAWQHLGGWEIPQMSLARLCQKAENEYLGVASGLMDQFASLFGQRRHALFLDCRTLAWEALPMPIGATLVVADTSTRRQLSQGALNKRQAECAEALRLLQKQLPRIKALRDVSEHDFRRFERRLPEPIRSRALHVIEECGRVQQAVEALQQGDVRRLGALMNASQISSRDLYESSGPEIDAMWEAANAHPACWGGRFVGAGFSGCLVFLVQSAGVDSFIEHTGERYTKITGLNPDLYATEAAGGAQVFRLD